MYFGEIVLAILLNTFSSIWGKFFNFIPPAWTNIFIIIYFRIILFSVLRYVWKSVPKWKIWSCTRIRKIIGKNRSCFEQKKKLFCNLGVIKMTSSFVPKSFFYLHIPTYDVVFVVWNVKFQSDFIKFFLAGLQNIANFTLLANVSVLSFLNWIMY